MSSRRTSRVKQRARTGAREHKDPHRCSGSMEMLAFKYMEMCKVESSTESDSDTSPRWSDTSAKGGVATKHRNDGIPRKASAQKTTRHHLLCLDPYDGSSEDSELCDGASRAQRQGGARVRGRVRRGGAPPREAGKCTPKTPPPPADVQMRSSSDSDSKSCEMENPYPSGEVAGDSGIQTGSPLSTPGLIRVGNRLRPVASETFQKRKSCAPGCEPAERDLRKRLCAVDVHEGQTSL